MTKRPTQADMALDAARLRALFHYDPISGDFIRIALAGAQGARSHVGKIAGCLGKNGYRAISINRREYYAHRLAWLYVTGDWPPDQIDHRDMNRANNAFDNLRLATNAENKRNSRPHSDNSSGFKGIYLHRPSGLWASTIMTDGRKRSLGYHKTPEAAHAAYVKAAITEHQQFARTQ